MDKEYYQNWRAENDPDIIERKAYERNSDNFWGNDPNEGPTRKPLAPEREKRRQEILSQTAQMFQRSDALHNPDKKTFGVFYVDSNPETLTKEEMMNIEKLSRASNSIFSPNTYQSEDWKGDILKSTTHSEHAKNQFEGSEPDKKFNLRRTVISEYSNALHNQTVFINPKFMSC